MINRANNLHHALLEHPTPCSSSSTPAPRRSCFLLPPKAFAPPSSREGGAKRLGLAVAD
ncbi:hypothetical protein HMPREF3185_02083 [Porphyromonas somerae]|uniref:Uncharacterized protein n=1 Tax=Porphyromonas somerae TaxID=322095 RepID=A0A134B095_9PORP|nr:hypothetical protein HMPREF3184_02083 [Porphyromonadaceae bacterium KA00676]KXB73341.1 hypothetical protein HMPREF3185_02083 [Porphyromonas somerae]